MNGYRDVMYFKDVLEKLGLIDRYRMFGGSDVVVFVYFYGAKQHET